MARSAHPNSTFYNEHFECGSEDTEVLVHKNAENLVACALLPCDVHIPTTRTGGERLTVP